MQIQKPKIPKKYQPRAYEVLHEDPDLLVGNKSAGYLTVAAKWNPDETIHDSLNHYVRKGSARSNKVVYPVHRLDQATSGVLIFAKTEKAMHFLKDNWKTTEKFYYAIVHGIFTKKSGKISSYLEEDGDYVVHSSDDPKGKLAETEYEVVQEGEKYSLLKINLLTGRKNQIRVHMAAEGHPVVGDAKYGQGGSQHKHMLLHAYSIEFTHPHSKKRLKVTAPPPKYFAQYTAFKFE